MDEKLNYLTTIKFLRKFNRNYKKNFIIFYLGWFIDMLVNLTIPILIGILIDEIVYYKNIDSFYRTISIVFIVLIYLCLQYFFIYAQHQYLSGKYTYDIRIEIFKHWQKLKAEKIGEQSYGSVLTLLQTYSCECLNFMIKNVVHFFNGILKLFFITIVLFYINWKIGVFILIAAPVSVYSNMLLGKKSKKYGEKHRFMYSAYNGWLYEIISSISTMRMDGAKEKVKSILCKKNTEIFEVDIKSTLVKMTSDNVINLINMLIKLAIFALAGMLAMQNRMTIGTLLLIISYYSIFIEQVWWTSNSNIDAQNRIGYIQCVYDFLKMPVEDNKEKLLQIKNGNIVFDNISFSYKNDSLIFNNLSLNIPSGKKVAIVGDSGCGKTTLTYLLLGFYSSQSGRIMIDNNNLSECSLESIRSQIGLISQDVMILNDTVKENIILGNKKATMKEIIDACKKAEIWDFIVSLPEGIDTIIGKNGINLSGGQKQRIAIARIYVKNPPIIIFDEATSSIDDKTENIIHKAWENVLHNRTSIVIAHKMNSVKMCDSVAVIKNGKIDAYGPTEEIIAYNEEFRRIFDLAEKNNCV